LLGYKDFRTLEWLESPEIKQSGRREPDFIKHVLLRLEETYKVDRNDVFKKNLINCDPRSQLMVSELSGSFLLLTPQWIYDGILLRGRTKKSKMSLETETPTVSKEIWSMNAILLNF